MPTELRRLTPPKYAAALEDRMSQVTLEQRLAHFVDWLRENNIRLHDHTSDSAAHSTRILPNSEIVEWIKEYVDS